MRSRCVAIILKLISFRYFIKCRSNVHKWMRITSWYDNSLFEFRNTASCANTFCGHLFWQGFLTPTLRSDWRIRLLFGRERVYERFRTYLLFLTRMSRFTITDENVSFTTASVHRISKHGLANIFHCDLFEYEHLS